LILKYLQQYFIVRGVDTTVQRDLRNSVQIKPNNKITFSVNGTHNKWRMSISVDTGEW